VLRRFVMVLAALVLPLATAVAAIAGPAAQPAAAASWHTPNPSIAVDNYHNQYVFWKGTDGHLWETFYDGSWHGPIGLPQMGILGSPPSVTISPVRSVIYGGRTLADQYVVWEGGDHNLWFAYWDGSWHGPSKLGFGPLASQPSVSADGSNGLVVVWKGTDGGLWFARSSPSFSASGWAGPSSIGEGPLNSAPSLTMGGGGIDAAWTGQSPQYDLWYHTAGTLIHIGFGPLDSPPSIVGLYADQRFAFWVGTDGTLWSGGWTYTALNNHLQTVGPGRINQSNGQSMGLLGSAPSAAFNTQTYYVVWQGQDNALWEATLNLSNGNWQLQRLGMGPL